MKITNNLNLPQPVVDAVKYDDYDLGDADISVTSLIGPSLQRKLKKAHEGEITMDASDMIFSLTGKALHEVLRRANASGLAEKRLYCNVDGYKIGGQFDHLVLDENLSDYKETSVWSVIFGNDSWEPQMNCYNYLLYRNECVLPKSLQVVAFLRDHQKSKAKTDPKYPPFRVHIVPIPMWSWEKTEQYIRGRLKVHFQDEPTCTDQERWQKSTAYAVMKKGRKSALRVLPTWKEAEIWKDKNRKGDYIEHRPGSYQRCESYCEVSGFCPLYEAQT